MYIPRSFSTLFPTFLFFLLGFPQRVLRSFDLGCYMHVATAGFLGHELVDDKSGHQSVDNRTI